MSWLSFLAENSISSFQVGQVLGNLFQNHAKHDSVDKFLLLAKSSKVFFSNNIRLFTNNCRIHSLLHVEWWQTLDTLSNRKRTSKLEASCQPTMASFYFPNSERREKYTDLLGEKSFFDTLQELKIKIYQVKSNPRSLLVIIIILWT